MPIETVDLPLTTSTRVTGTARTPQAKPRPPGFSLNLNAADAARIAARETAAKNRLTPLGLEEDAGGGPKGFPTGTGWIDAQTMVTRNRVTGVIVHESRLHSARTKALQEEARRTVSRPVLPPLTDEERRAEEEAKGFLKSAGVKEAATGQPEGFPEGYRWAELRKRATTNVTDGVELDPVKLKKTLQATEALAQIGITDIRPPFFKSGTTVLEALEQVLKENREGITISALRSAGLELTDFPRPITAYEAFKMVEDSSNALGIDRALAQRIKADYEALKKEGIFSIQQFKPYGARDASSALKLFRAEPTKFYELTNTPPPSKPRWKVPPLFNAPKGASSDQVRALALENALRANPDYSRAEVMAKFGLVRTKRLG
jgi:hypothetical protein